MACKLSCIAVMDQNRVMANAAGIPWKLPADVAHFRAYTRGKWLLLGRRTFLEMQGWFKADQMPLVLTTDCGFSPRVGRAVASVPQALALAEAGGATELVNCGGAGVFRAAMPYADRLVLTRVACSTPAAPDLLYFPEWSESEWRRDSVVTHAADSANPYSFQIETWQRRRPTCPSAPCSP